MGLDNYFNRDDIKKDEDGKYEDQAFKDALAEVDFNGEDLTLSTCGMFSGTGPDGSFRGKCYYEFVEEATGESIYDDLIEPDRLVQMGDKIAKFLSSPHLNLLKYIKDNYPNFDGWTEEELKQTASDWTKLGKLFKAFGLAGFHLTSWY